MVVLGLPILAPSENGGSTLGSVTDITGDAGSCTVSTVDGLPYYRAMIDGLTESFPRADGERAKAALSRAQLRRSVAGLEKSR